MLTATVAAATSGVEHLLVAALTLLGTAGFRNVAGAPETVRAAYRDGADEVVAVLGSAWSRGGTAVWVAPARGGGRGSACRTGARAP